MRRTSRLSPISTAPRSTRYPQGIKINYERNVLLESILKIGCFIVIWVRGQVTKEVTVVHPEWDPDEGGWVEGTEANAAANGVGDAYDEYPFSVSWAGESELAGASGATASTTTQGAAFGTNDPLLVGLIIIVLVVQVINSLRSSDKRSQTKPCGVPSCYGNCEGPKGAPAAATEVELEPLLTHGGEKYGASQDKSASFPSAKERKQQHSYFV